jgi:hypothetical protein
MEAEIKNLNENANKEEFSRKVISSISEEMTEDQIKEFTYILIKNFEAKSITTGIIHKVKYLKKINY